MTHERSPLAAELATRAPLAPEAFVRAAKDATAGALVDAPFERAALLIAFTSGDATSRGDFEVSAARSALTRAEGMPVNLVALRDVAALAFQCGCAGVAESAEELARALVSLVDELAPTVVVTYGEGLAGYAALQFGAELHRRFSGVRAVAFGPPSTLSVARSDAEGDARHRRSKACIEARRPAGVAADLADLLAQVAREVSALPARVAYGTAGSPPFGRDRDDWHASRFVSVPGVEVVQVAESDHAVGAWLASHARLVPLFAPGEDGAPAAFAAREGAASVARVAFEIREGGESTARYATLVAPAREQGKPIDRAWQRWISENLMLDLDAFELGCTLVEHGHGAAEARAAVEAVADSPILEGASRLRARLTKRDWLLRVLRKGRALHPEGDAVPVVPALDRATFLREHYATGRPVVMTGAFDDWPARTRWTLEYLRARCGDVTVEAQSGREGNARFEIESSAFRRTMRFDQCLDTIERIDASGSRTNDLYITAGNGTVNEAALAALWPDTRPTLPEYLDPAGRVPNGFFWLGPRGTVTPLHHDLTNNFMAQVLGRKRVWLVAPEETPVLANHVHCYSEVDLRAIDYDRFPALRDVRVLEVILEPGQLLFLPVGWWHQVEGLDTTITMTYVNFLWPNEFAADYATYGPL
jgi:hypothetical protein